MAGIGHRGFMGRRRGDNFRYLFEEVPGVVTGWAQIKLRRDYSGYCVSLGNQSIYDYNFSNNQAPISQILSDHPTGQTGIILYDQISSNDLSRDIGHGFNSSDENYDRIFEQVSARYDLPTNLDNITSSTPATVYFVLKKDNTDSGVLWAMNESSTLRFDMAFQVSGNLFVRINNITVNYGTSFNSNSDNNLWCVTYDGSESSAGIKLYRNDMVTEVPYTSRTSPATTISAATFNQVYSLGVSTTGNNCVQGLVTAQIVCETLHSQSEREAVKSIFEQSPLYVFG